MKRRADSLDRSAAEEADEVADVEARDAEADNDTRRLSAALADLQEELEETHRGVVVLHAQLARTERSRNAFLAMLAHELRNPLAVAALALEEPGDEGRAVVRRQLLQLTRLVDDLLDASRVVRGKISLFQEPLDLSSLVSDVVAERQPLFAREGRVLRWQEPTEACGVHGDEARLRQLITNLLDNAQKYSEGTDVHVSLRAAPDHLLLSVRDEGRGLTREEMAKVFDLFVQADRSLAREPGGLGIGLTLVRQLAQAHGGDVGVQSDGLGHGATFVARLPRIDLDSVRPAPKPAVVEMDPSLEGARVLLVEDGDELRALLKARLERLGFRVVAAEDGATALESLASEPAFDVVLADVGLPGMDGYQLAERIGAEQPDLPLVAMTGYGSSEHQQRASEAGFDMHLVKPVAFDTLVDVLKRLIHRPKA